MRSFVFLIMRRKKRRKKKAGNTKQTKAKKKKNEILVNIAVLIITIIFVLVILDIAIRIMFPNPYLYDEKYGWRYSGPEIRHLEIQNDKNWTRNVTVEYFENGFKRWGNVSTNKTKVLIIGDSFTEMNLVNNGEEWYSYLEREFSDKEFFVYGAGGYGSLQEYMILDEYIDKINPDIIIIQFHYNDFLDNVYEFEIKEYPLSNQAYRPYLENGKINMRLPLKFSELRRISRIFGLAIRIYDKKQREKASSNKDDFYYSIYGDEFDVKKFDNSKIFDGKFNKSLNVTTQIFKMIRDRAKDKKIYMFNVDKRTKWAEEYICNQSNITFIPGISDHVFLYENSGFNTQVVNDGHWNVLGNRLAGQFLVKYFKKDDFFSKIEKQ